MLRAGKIKAGQQGQSPAMSLLQDLPGGWRQHSLLYREPVWEELCLLVGVTGGFLTQETRISYCCVLAL